MSSSLPASAPAGPQPLPRVVLRNIAGVVAALVVVVALMIGSNLALINFLPPTAPLYLAITLLGAWLFHMGGGWICAAITRDSVVATGTLVAVGAVLMIQSVHQTWAGMPPWYSVLMLVIAPLALWLGTRLHGRRA